MKNIRNIAVVAKKHITWMEIFEQCQCYSHGQNRFRSLERLSIWSVSMKLSACIHMARAWVILVKYLPRIEIVYEYEYFLYVEK